MRNPPTPFSKGGIKIFLLLASLALVGCKSTQVSAPAKIAAATAPTQTLSQALAKIGADFPEADIGVSIVNTRNNESLYGLNEVKLYTPASTAKMLTFAAALHYLGPQFHYDTGIYTQKRTSHIIQDLVLKASGDPSFSSVDIAQLISELRQLGVSKVAGDIIIDASIFDDVPYGSAWMPEDFDEGYSAPISGISVDDNRIVFGIFPGPAPHKPALLTSFPHTKYFAVENQLTTTKAGSSRSLKLSINQPRPKGIGANATVIVSGKIPALSPVKYESLAVQAPADLAAFIIKEELKKNGIVFKGKLRTGVTPSDAELITHHYSVPLSEMSINFAKMSNNHATETLLKTIGAVTSGAQGSFDNGLLAIKQFLEKEVKLQATGLVAADGSGLSRENRISAKQLTDLLVYMWKNFQTGPEFISSLAIYGEDGTLKKRSDGLLKKSVRGKTGSMQGIKSLAGYLQLDSGDVIAFALLINGAAPSGAAQKIILDKILVAVKTNTAS